MPAQVKGLPRLKPKNYSLTSPETDDYNCIGWAAGEDDRWWWPRFPYFWPQGIPTETTVEAFAVAFATMGYKKCDSGALDPNVEKVAIYTKDGQVTHMARQLISGKWTSKLGESYDIEHDTPVAVSGGAYGIVAQFLCRPKS